MDRTIRVCQNTTCRKQGSADVLSAFENSAPQGVVVEAASCLGHCGSGPNAVILPDNEWCLHVQPEDVQGLMRQHFQAVSASAKTDRELGTQSNANTVFRLWLAVIGGIAAATALASWLIAKNSYYI